MIVKQGNGYEVESRSGKNLGSGLSKGQAEKRLEQVEYFRDRPLSDEDSKKKIEELEGQNEQFRAVLGAQQLDQQNPYGSPANPPGALRAAPLDQGNPYQQAPRALDANPYQSEAFRQPTTNLYEYKDPTAPGAAPGQHVGPMAQELEGMPGVVETGPDGLKRVNAPRLSLATAAQTGQHRRELDAHRKKLEELQAHLNALQGDPDAELNYAAGVR